MSRDSYDMFSPPERGRFGDNEHADRRSSPRVNGASDLHDIECALHVETAKAVLVSIDGAEAKASWLPKSQIEIVRDRGAIEGVAKDGRRVALTVITVTAPEWLAKRSGLL